jgi:rsbT co-antagonist protein RsbR
MAQTNRTGKVLEAAGADILERWVQAQLAADTMRRELIDAATLREQSRTFLDGFRQAVAAHGVRVLEGEGWDRVRALLDGIARARAEQGFSPAETALFVFSLKQPLFDAVQADAGGDGTAELGELWQISAALDRLGLHTIEQYQSGREVVIRRQQQEILELSTPVVQLWEGVLAIPLIGTLDSERTQIVMENLLEAIVDHEATVAIIDITGVPAVDTLVAQHLIKTASAARLMGADCIISGIRPQIAQTMVHLGIELEDIATRASLSGAIDLAFRRRGLAITARGS